MMWYVDRITMIENNFSKLSDFQKTLFLQLINSDILSSVEKISPKIKLDIEGVIEDFIIYRSERGFEGENYLKLVDEPKYSNDRAPHIKKLFARIKKILFL